MAVPAFRRRVARRSSLTTHQRRRIETAGALPRARTSLRGVVAFFVTTFLSTWSFWFAASVSPGGFGPDTYPRAGLPLVLFYLGVFSPAFVAIAFTQHESGSQGVRALLQRLFIADVPARWYAFAFAYMATVKLIAALVHRLIFDVWPTFGTTSWLILVGATMLSTLVFGQAGEEVGWRGYALPRLAARIGFGPSAVIIGIVWASWHLPLFFIKGNPTTGGSFPLYLLQVTALSVAITWLYLHTRGSLLLTMLMHAAINNTTEIVPSIVTARASNPFGLSVSPIGWITAGILWIAAIYFLAAPQALKPPRDA